MNRSWAEYKVGFSDPSGNYWLGNDLLSQLTANYSYKLRFDLQQHDTGTWYYAEYSTFRVLSEAYNYQLHVGGYSGNASYDALGYHNRQQFTTLDRDNDAAPGNCAAWHGGGFWYRRCALCFANAARSTGRFYWDGLPGDDWRDTGGRHLQSTRMWLKCK